MKNVIKLSLVAAMAITVLSAEETPAKANSLEEMFKNGTVSGNLEVMYSGHDEDSNSNSGSVNSPYSTAIGGQLGYKLAPLNGFTAAVEFTTVHEIAPLSGDENKGKRATMMIADYNTQPSATSEDSYTEVSQAYLEYAINGLTLRAGRQLIDTPLADSDDIRIVNNTFEAYIATYEMDNISLIGGLINQWQGTDAGLDTQDPWQNTGDDGTYFGGVSFAADLLDASVWYYDISESKGSNSSMGNVANKSIYADATVHAISSDSFGLDLSAQYLTQNEEDNSGIDADIFGLMIEASVADLGLIVAYNERSSSTGTSSFSGFGGGTLFTNMDNMIIDTMSNEDADVLMLGVTYDIADFSIYAMVGEFNGDTDSGNAKEEIIEYNIGFDYAASDNLTLSAICTINDDKENTNTSAIYSSGDFTNIRVSVAYAF